MLTFEKQIDLVMSKHSILVYTPLRESGEKNRELMSLKIHIFLFYLDGTRIS
jgi:hypothetical protein